MKFKKSLIKSTYLFSFFLIFSYFLGIIEMILQSYTLKINGGQIGWNLQVWLPLLLITIISKWLLIKYEIEINPFHYFHYFGIYKLIGVIRNVVFLVGLYIRYSGYPKEQFVEQIKIQAHSVIFNLILGVMLIYWGYRYYKEY